MTPQVPPLFVTSAECGALLGIAESSWPRIRRKWEERGFPKPNPETGKYLWPAVRTWVFKDNGFNDTTREFDPQDGLENWS